MQERNAMLKELEKEDRKHDEMMEKERIHAQKMEEEMEKRKKEEQMIGALEILEQIELNEQVWNPLLSSDEFYRNLGGME